MIKATFDDSGFPSAYYPDGSVEDHLIPGTAIELTEEQHTEFMSFPGLRKWDGSKVVEYTPPAPEPEPVVIILPAVTLWERLTEAEAEQVNAVMATQPFRTRQIFLTANTFRSDHELWPLLESMATGLFGEARTAELLADPSELVAKS